MTTNATRVNPAKRLVYAFIGLLVGDATLLLFLLVNALLVRISLLGAHMGEPAKVIPVTIEIFVVYAIFSLAGWLLVGLPTALFIPARSVAGLSWPLVLLVGSALGPLGLLAIMVLLGRGHISFPAIFTSLGVLWIYSIVVSSVSFVIYTALLRKHLNH